MQTALILCRFLHFSVVLVLFGTCLFRGLVFKPWLGVTNGSPLDATLKTLTRWLSGLALISALAWLVLTAASMAGDWQDGVDPSTLMLVLGNTFYGKVWVWHLLFSAVLLVCVSLPTSASPVPKLVLCTLLLATLAPVGHGAMFDGLFGQLLILNQFIHLSAVGAWLGGLVLLGLVLLQPAVSDLRSLLLRFSGIGYGLVATIIVTGLINVRVLSGAVWPEPAFSGFGLILAIKVALVLCMLALALFNRLLLGTHGYRLEVLRVSVVIECLFGLAAVAAVSLLGTLPPMLAG